MPRGSDAQAQIGWGCCHWGFCSLCAVMVLEERRGEEFQRNMVLKGFIGVLWHGLNALSGNVISIVFSGEFQSSMDKYCLTETSTLPRTFLGYLPSEISSCVMWSASWRGKELDSLLQYTFKKTRSQCYFSSFPFKTRSTWDLCVSVYTSSLGLFFVFHHSQICVNEQVKITG